MAIDYRQVYARGLRIGKSAPEGMTAAELHSQVRHSQGRGSSSTRYNRELRRGLVDGVRARRA